MIKNCAEISPNMAEYAMDFLLFVFYKNHFCVILRKSEELQNLGLKFTMREYFSISAEQKDEAGIPDEG